MIPPLEHLFDIGHGSSLPLPPALRALYKELGFPEHAGRPYVIANFVSTLDGVVSLDVPGQAVGSVIGGFNQQDSMVMGLLRAAADVVIVGAGTLRASPGHVWTPEFVFPSLATDYEVLRKRMGLAPSPLNVVVTARGNVDIALPVFQSDEVPVLIVTTDTGARRIEAMHPPRDVQVVTAGNGNSLMARDILSAITDASPSTRLMLIEGGPHLIGDFLAERSLDELFLTLAPQVAGRENSQDRLGFVEGRLFAPEQPSWGSLVSVKRGGSHLFLRYSFP